MTKAEKMMLSDAIKTSIESHHQLIVWKRISAAAIVAALVCLIRAKV